MGKSWSIAVCLALSGHLLCAEPEKRAVNRQDFQLQLEVVDMLEDGPFVLKATLTYNGNQPIEVYQRENSNVSIKTPQGWEAVPVVYLHVGPDGGLVRLAPGDQLTELLPLHRLFSSIPSGKVILTGVWNLWDDGKRVHFVAAPTCALEAIIPAATPEHLGALRKRMEDQLCRPSLSEEDRRTLVEEITYTRHKALVPVAWQMIETARFSPWTYGLIEFVSEHPDDTQEFDTRLAKLAADPNWPGEWGAFAFWGNRKAELPPAAWKTLTEAEGVWTRALTYVAFSKRCRREWKESLLQELRSQGKPLPSPQFERLLAELDDNDFAVREKASAQLGRLGERVEAQLRHAVGSPLSAEVRVRATEILRKLEKAKQPPDCLRALDYLEVHEAPENGELLQVLAEGQPDAWLTQQAKTKLAEWRKDRGLPDK